MLAARLEVDELPVAHDAVTSLGAHNSGLGLGLGWEPRPGEGREPTPVRSCRAEPAGRRVEHNDPARQVQTRRHRRRLGGGRTAPGTDSDDPPDHPNDRHNGDDATGQHNEPAPRPGWRLRVNRWEGRRKILIENLVLSSPGYHTMKRGTIGAEPIGHALTHPLSRRRPVAGTPYRPSIADCQTGRDAKS